MLRAWPSSSANTSIRGLSDWSRWSASGFFPPLPPLCAKVRTHYLPVIADFPPGARLALTVAHWTATQKGAGVGSGFDAAPPLGRGTQATSKRLGVEARAHGLPALADR